MTDALLRVAAGAWLPPNFTSTSFPGQIEVDRAQSDEALRTIVRDADVLYAWRVPESVPSETPRLRWVQLPSAGTDHLRELPVWDSNVIITAAQGVHTVPMSEHLFAMALALTRQIPDYVRAQDRHEWYRQRADQGRVTELRGKTMGIIGWGKIGNGVAHLARAFGMRVIGTRWTVLVPREAQPTGTTAYADSPWLEPVDLPLDILFPPAQLHEVLAQSDLVVLLLPLTDETRGSFAEAEFRAMRRGALFFNLGRGAVVQEDALIRALQTGKIDGAGLDVYTQEPLPRQSALWTMPNVIISPHVGGVGEGTRERAAWLFAVNLTHFLEGKELLNVVDRDHGY